MRKKEPYFFSSRIFGDLIPKYSPGGRTWSHIMEVGKFPEIKTVTYQSESNILCETTQDIRKSYKWHLVHWLKFPFLMTHYNNVCNSTFDTQFRKKRRFIAFLKRLFIRLSLRAALCFHCTLLRRQFYIQCAMQIATTTLLPEIYCKRGCKHESAHL